MEISRRAFVGALGAGAAVATLGRTSAAAKGANDQLVLGCIGVGGQGVYRLNELLKQR